MGAVGGAVVDHHVDRDAHRERPAGHTITANTGAAARTATVTINGITVTMTQSSAAPPPPTGFHVVGGSSRQ